MDSVSIKNISKVIAMIGVFISVFFLLPISVGLFTEERVESFMLFDISIFVISMLVYVNLVHHKVTMKIKDAILTVNLIWLLLGILGAIPLVLSTDISFVDGFFESVSGFTTTGATIYTDIANLPKHILLLRSLMHWLGGMGIIVLGVGLFSIINPTGSMALFKAESTGVKLEKMTAKIKDTAIKIWIVYLVLTLLDMFLLWIEGMSLFDALNHAFSTLSTGGFSTKNNSMGYWEYQPLIIWTTTIFMILSGINFLAHLKLVKGDWSGYRSEEVKWYMIIFVVLSVMLTAYHLDLSDDSFGHALTHSFFSVASILTTTGFITVDYERWGNLAVAIIFIAMLVGGNAGSTAGGFKVSRYVVLIKNIGFQIKKLLHPKAIMALYIDKHRITHDTMAIISGYAFLFIITNIIVIVWLFGSGYDIMTSLSASISMVGNIGPGFARVGAVENYHFFRDIDKIILSMAMILGRLEFYTVVMLFSRSYWSKF